MKTADRYSDFYKNDDSDSIYWCDKIDTVGEFLFSFDKKKIYNLFEDYPHALSADEKQLFDDENSYWKEFFANRS